MSKKKILILMMSCNDDFFIQEEEIAKRTWAKDIVENKYENIDFLAYRGVSSKHSIDWNKNLFSVRCEDGLDNTFKKTYYTLSIIQKKYDYDYIFRCNTSTYINVPLLDAFVQSIEDDSVLWASELYSLSEGFCPYPLNLFARGNGFLISRKLVDIIIKEGISFIYLKLCDDWVIGNILNSYWIKNGEDYLNHIKSYPHGWWKCISTNAKNNNSICMYNNDNSDFEYMKTFLTVQVKRYHQRELEHENYQDLYDTVYKDKVDNDIENTVKNIYTYSQNPNVFIGSILGYISYNDWLKLDKNKLYILEVNNKATDDEQRKNKHSILL